MAYSRVGSMAALVALAALGLSSCGDNNPTAPEGNPALVGTYSLVSITFQGQPTLGPPVATGSLTLTDSTYTVTITIAVPGQPQEDIQDSGTYSVSGNTWTQTSTVQNVQSIGTYTLTDGTLSVDVSTSGQQQSSVWQKQ